MSDEYDVSKVGLIAFGFAVFIFTLMVYQVVGYLCIIVGPVIALLACRPATDGGPCLWEKRK